VESFLFCGLFDYIWRTDRANWNELREQDECSSWQNITMSNWQHSGY